MFSLVKKLLSYLGLTEQDQKENDKITQNANQETKDKKMNQKFTVKTKIVEGHKIEYFDLDGERWYSLRCMLPLTQTSDRYPGACIGRPAVVAQPHYSRFKYVKRCCQGIVYVSTSDLKRYICDRNTIAKDMGYNRGWSELSAKFIATLFHLKVVVSKSAESRKTKLAPEGTKERSLQELYRGSERMQQMWKHQVNMHNYARCAQKASYKQLELFSDHLLEAGK